MFVFSFKASSVKIMCILCACLIVGALVIALMPEAGYAVNVNKVSAHSDLSKISVKNDSGRIQYLESLGFSIRDGSCVTSSALIPKTFDAATEQYNKLQKQQGFDLEKYKDKKVTSYTYQVTTMPDGTSVDDKNVLATLIIYKNKVIAADLCCEKTGTVSGIITAA